MPIAEQGRRRWTPEEEAAVAQGRHQGLTSAEIGALLNRTERSVLGYVQRLDLPRRRGKHPVKVSMTPGAVKKRRQRKRRKDGLHVLDFDRFCNLGKATTSLITTSDSWDMEAISERSVAQGQVNRGIVEGRKISYRGTFSDAKICQWPFGDPKGEDYHICGATEVVPKRPYCVEHMRKGYDYIK